MTFEQLTAYCLNELSAAERAGVERAVAANPEAAALLRTVRAMIETMRTDDTVLPSREVLDRARQIASQPTAFGAMAAKVGAWWDRVADSVAGVVFDSRAQLAASGFRGGATGTQLAFASDDAEVDLMATEPEAASGGLWTVRGQVESTRGESVQAVAVIPQADAQAEPIVMELVPDERGQFRFQTASTVFNIRVLVGERVIDIGGPTGVQLG